MQFFRTMLILSHRYIGIPLSFMFVLWFVSAFFMIYTGGMPRITPAMQADGAEPVDFSRVNLSPQQAAEAAGFTPPDASLRTILQRPVYEFNEPGYGSTFIYADTGAPMARLDEAQSAQLAASFLDIPVEQLAFAGSLSEADQWTLTSLADLPLYKFTAADGLGTEVYVSPDKAVVSVYTTSRSRALAWVGTIPHWLYFTSLRMNQPLWYGIVVWSSGIGCVMALLGLCLGFTQWRSVKPFSLKRAIPYQGLMRWHYILGIVFGFFTLTWVFSGLLSMEPFAWTNAPGIAVDGEVYAEGELDLAAYPALNSLVWKSITQNEIKQVDFNWIQGEPYLLTNYSVPADAGSEKRDRLHQPYNIAGQSEAQSLLVNARTGVVSTGFDVEHLVAKLDASISDAAVTDYAVLDSYDDYYYSRQSQLPLPVLRVKFDDPVASWIYVDPVRSELLTTVNKWSRLERWLYNGLHSLDFAFWYHQRPLWDIGVIVLLLGGLGTSVIGLYFGLRRLGRDVLALVHKLKSHKPAKEAAHATH
jgi:hypothetical protein